MRESSSMAISKRRSPNGWMCLAALHRALALAAASGCRLVTVNFDDLAEQAIEDLDDPGLQAFTIDAYARRRPKRAWTPGVVAKLHGALRMHTGSGAVSDGAPAQATISSIARGGSGSGLLAAAEKLLRSGVDGRDLRRGDPAWLARPLSGEDCG